MKRARAALFTDAFFDILGVRRYFKDGVKGQLVVDIVKLEKMYPITNRPLLIKCGVVLSCVIMSFFLHPVTHLDPAWIAIMGAVW